jgi:ribosomal protein L27
LRRDFVRKILLFAVLAVLPGSLYAGCSNPGISQSETILRFGENGAIGTAGSVGYGKEGSVFYDSSSSSLKVCDGTAWKSIGSDDDLESVTPTGAMAVNEVFSKIYNEGGYFTLPLNTPGDYRVNLNSGVSGLGKDRNDRCRTYAMLGGGDTSWILNAHGDAGYSGVAADVRVTEGGTIIVSATGANIYDGSGAFVGWDRTEILDWDGRIGFGEFSDRKVSATVDGCYVIVDVWRMK